MIIEYKNRKNFFDKVTLAQKISDVLTAIYHSIFGLHKSNYPFNLYYKKLTSYIESEESKIEYLLNCKKNEIDDISDEDKKLSEDELQRRIVSINEEIPEKEKDVQEAETFKLFQEDEFNDKYNKVINRYEKWYECLGRRPFFELFDYRSLFNLENKNKDDENTNGKKKNFISETLSSLYKKIIFILKKIFYIAYPMEIYFALPAFQFITPENKQAAWAGAVILVGALYLLGYYSGSLLNRSKMNIIDVDCKNNNPKVISTFIHKYFAIILTIVVIVSSMVILTGTALRTMVFSVERNIDLVKEINEKIQTSSKNKDESIKVGNTQEVESYNKEIEELKKDRKELIDDRLKIREQNLIPNTADGYLALSIYITLYLAPLLSMILKTDPYFEYYLISSEASMMNEIKHDREYHKYNYIKLKKNELGELKNRLAQLKKFLDLKKDKNDLNIKDTTEKLATSGHKSFTDIAKAWRKQRMITYYTTYMLLSGKKIRSLYKDEKEDNYLC